MSANNYLNLLFQAGITDKRDQERYGRYLDAAIAQEGFTTDEIIGVGERGTGSRNDLYVITRQAVLHVSEVGMFSKRIETNRLGPIASIANLRGTQEGFKGTDVTLTATAPSGEVLFKIFWGLGGPDWVEPLILRQRQHLFELISRAMDELSEAPIRRSVAPAASKAGALMDWAADVVKAAGVEVTNACVQEHANMIAGMIRMFVFLPLGQLDDLNNFYPTGRMPQGPPIDTFDDLYDHVVARLGGSRQVDRGIDEYLARSWAQYVDGCRENYASVG